MGKDQKTPKQGGEPDDLAETKRIMERLVRTPPKPHKDKNRYGEAENRPNRKPSKPSDV